MRHRYCPHLIVLLTFIAMLSVPISLARAGDADAVKRAVFDRLAHSIQTNDREEFLKDASDAVKKLMTPELMKRINADLGPHMAKGFDVAYLTRLNQKTCVVDLWKLTMKDGSDDLVFRIVTKNDVLMGFFIE